MITFVVLKSYNIQSFLVFRMRSNMLIFVESVVFWVGKLHALISQNTTKSRRSVENSYKVDAWYEHLKCGK